MDEARGPEDRIEHIVREAESGAQFEFNPAAWSAMESKLDAAAPVPFAWWKILFPIAGTAILLTLLLWPIAARDTDRAGNALSKEQAVKEQPVERTEPQKALVSTENPGSQVPDANPDNSTQSSVADGSQNASGREDSASTNNLAQTSTSNSETSNASENLVEKVSDDGNASYTFRASVEQDKTESIKDSDQASPAVGGSEENLVGQGVEMLAVRWEPQPLMFPEPLLIFELDSSVYADEVPETEYFQKSKWAFSAAVSADLSATGLEGFTDPGTMIGFAVEYYLADTWSIQSGATYAVKRYTALGSEYETPEWILARPDDFLSAVAKCTVIDIPINIRKYFHTKKGKTFFASSGVSTYLMLREDYNYEYTEPRPNWAPFWRYDNRNNHFLGILNLSVGYETPITKNLALGIEPFMKLPLTGIGEGRVRFLSFGSNIAIKLRK